jgi:hypothetical protein
MGATRREILAGLAAGGVASRAAAQDEAGLKKLAEGEELRSNLLRLRDFEDVPKGTDFPRNRTPRTAVDPACSGRARDSVLG